jgi:predicted house-cleaning noncanonical NTP pyrophosphatase (MazG superfamily)
MKRFYFNKLVRDKIIAKNESNPEVLHSEYRVLSSGEYRQELKKKLLEELDEVLLSEGDRGEMVKEFGDLQAVIAALRDSFDITEQEVKEAMSAKADDAGEFSCRYFIEYVDIEDNSKWVEIFRSQPNKYKERNV